MRGVTVILAFLTAFSCNCFSQIAKDDFAKINKAYVTYGRLSMKMKYELYRNKDTKLVFQTEAGELKKDGGLQYSRIGKIETVRTKDYDVLVDHEDKNISILGRKIDEPSFSESAYLVNLEKVLKTCIKVEFNNENNRENSYLVELPRSEYKQVKIVYDKKTFLISKMVLFYKAEQNLEEEKDGLKEAPRLEISYLDIDTNPRFKGTEFSYEKYIQKIKGKAYCREAYKGYTLSDHSL